MDRIAQLSCAPVVRRRVILIRALGCGLALCFANVAASAAVVGGWDVTRGGPFSLSDGANTAPLRALLLDTFPGTSLTGSNELTPAYLSTIDALVISAAFDNFTPITPLAASEQTALMNFVLGGGRALLLGERTGFSPLVNPTLIDPFGPTIVGDTFADPTATVANPLATPFTSVPFGQVNSLTTTNPGWFGGLGGAQSVATLDSNNEPVLAFRPSGDLAPGSGPVILSADSDIYIQNGILIFNTFAFLIAPEPSSLFLAACGTLCIGFTLARRMVAAKRRARRL